jgi:ubiquinone/menaquinone biosynthesis C-methylase UbiE
MPEKLFSGAVERLRLPERVARLEVDRVADLSLAGAELATVLDVGMGSGLFAEAFAQRGRRVAGVDINPTMPAAARQYVPASDFRLAAAEALPFPAEAFDLLFYGLLLHESDEPLTVLQEARRVARQRVCILEWPYQSQPFGPPLEHRLPPSTIADLARQAGFAPFETIPLANVTLYRLTI